MTFRIAQHGLAQQRIRLDSTARAARVGVGRGLLASLLLMAASAGGCARRAYNDVYVENMAAEIRDLEDQLYDFDNEYRVMEQQIDALKAENARLRANLPANSSGRNFRQSNTPSPSDSTGGENFLPRGGASKPPTTTPTPTPATPGKSSPSPAPSLEIGPAPATNPSKSTPNVPAEAKPSPNMSTPSMPTPQLTPGAVQPPATLPPPKSVPGADQFRPDDLQPPTVEPGEPMPPNLPPLKASPNNPVTLESDHQLELELGQIKLPAQLASARMSSDSDAAIASEGQIYPAAEIPNDSRIVEVKFHPTLCRAINTDQQGDDDGLYLVLQPYNSAGEFVPLPADLMVLALDLSRDEKHATIGRGHFRQRMSKTR